MTGFSTKQAESLTTFVSNAISNTNKPINSYLNKEIVNLTLNVARLQFIIKKMISFQQFNGERPTTQASSLPGFSVEKTSDPSNIYTFTGRI